MHNSRNPAVKRLMREAMDLSNPTELYAAQPLEDNLFEWHFTIRGPSDSDFDGGVYHGRILIPSEYPMKPPNIMLLTPNGRFEINKKICLSISGFHPESWRPAWSIRTALLALIGFMPTHGLGAIGSLEYPAEERRRLARLSRDWQCPTCGQGLAEQLKDLSDESAKDSEEAKELAKEISMTGEKPKSTETEAANDGGGGGVGNDTSRGGSSGSSLPPAASAPALASMPTATATATPTPTPRSLAPPLSFHDWLVQSKGFSSQRARAIVAGDAAAAPSSPSPSPSPSSPTLDAGRSLLRDEWPTVGALLVLAVSILLLVVRRSLAELDEALL